MKRTACVIACIAVLAAGCGSSDNGSDAQTKPAAGLASTVTQDGVYAVGKDIKPGVYTAKGECAAYTASSADFDIMDDNADDDAYISGSMRVGDVQRIELHDGEFFTSRSCSAWTREASSKAASADPATLAGGCEILMGKGKVAQAALGFTGKKESAADKASRGRLQDQLFTVVGANNPKLADPAGQLVDFLDDPAAYLDDDGKVGSTVLRAFSDIQKACAHQSN
ncbi:hypothetical protein ASE12_02390 [Aeromicrobium sp. Root236]|uniref:hypothetical protein n=1 Tax=Aeromicrobium sp. Root236 TaxID=1736498 RepID=UPI0006FA96F6|nr:hypothetical protein [Aeromicrobium sp. Root236]KRC63715.1 hypothetical protein ASE12_02390 [Aeromicrobium sp. Root236]